MPLDPHAVDPGGVLRQRYTDETGKGAVAGDRNTADPSKGEFDPAFLAWLATQPNLVSYGDDERVADAGGDSGKVAGQGIPGGRPGPEGEFGPGFGGLASLAPRLESTDFEAPDAIARFTRTGTGFGLPYPEDSMLGLRRLQMGGAYGLEGLLDPATAQARRQQIEDDLFAEMQDDLTRAYTDTRQGIREENFGRGVGLSTITGDDLGRLEKERNDALISARRNARVAAGGESRADDAARLAAVGNAFASGTTGLQGEANVGLANAGREQQARQFAAQSGFENLMTRLNREQRERLFGREIGSRESLTREGFRNARDIASANRLTSGVSAGLGGLASFFAPAINTASRAASQRLIDAF